jgi:thymidylate kinase
MRLVYLIGTDGAGKTTLAHNVVGECARRGVRAHYFYARHFPFLLLPAKLVARASLMRGTGQFRNYSKYTERKQQQARRLRLASRLYGFIWATDYVLVTWLRMLFTGTGQYRVIDRYFLDVAVNIAASLGFSDEEFRGLVRRMSRFFPAPDLFIYIDVPPETAFQRKSDIPSPLYLEERRRRYLMLADAFGFRIIDGTKTPDELTSEVYEMFGSIERAA